MIHTNEQFTAAGELMPTRIDTTNGLLFGITFHFIKQCTIRKDSAGITSKRRAMVSTINRVMFEMWFSREKKMWYHFLQTPFLSYCKLSPPLGVFPLLLLYKTLCVDGKVDILQLRALLPLVVLVLLDNGLYCLANVIPSVISWIGTQPWPNVAIPPITVNPARVYANARKGGINEIIIAKMVNITGSVLSAPHTIQKIRWSM